MAVTLYHWWGSTCSRKARTTLAEKGVDWESVHIDLHQFENWAPWYVKIHPNGVVPAMDHDGRIVIESNAILEYIDETFDGPELKPVETWERANMRVWMDKSEHVLHKNMHLISHNNHHAHRWGEYAAKHGQEALMDKVRSQPDLQRRYDEIRNADGISDDVVAFAVERVKDQMSMIEKDLERGPWITGDTFSLADIAVLPFVDRFSANGYGEEISEAKRPRLAEWFARIQERPGVKEAYSFMDPDLEAC
ncbi:MAG: glutathione S-transferase family protein [Proteobacteria bacterium]|nr:glutathione S-transferase family protein [Pseudomonadota bacterium]